MVNGFPRLPVEVKGELRKKQWEILLRQYLSEHYSKSAPTHFQLVIPFIFQTGLASGKLERKVPYDKLQKDTARFIASKYLPDNIIIKDPRNMLKEDVARLLRHIYERQINEGVHKAFRFKVFLGKEKKDQTARYEDPNIPLTPTVRQTIRKRVRKQGRTDTTKDSNDDSRTVNSSDESTHNGSAACSETVLEPLVRYTRSRAAKAAVKGKGKGKETATAST